MSQPGPLAYLNYCGTEIANSARTVSYLRKGLGNTNQGHWDIGPGDVCSVLYRLDGGTLAHPHVFASPQADPAPWYDSAEPGAASFLGFVLLDIKGYDSVLQRSVASQLGGLGGGVFGGQTRTPRTWKFRAAMISADDAGAEYGLRWLTQKLQASACATCSTCELSVRLVCPPADGSNDTLGEWFSYDVALTDGPHEVEPWGPAKKASTTDILGECRDYVIVEWTMVAGNPYLYKRPQTKAYYTLTQATVCTDICMFLFGSNAPQCVSIAAPKKGVLGSIVALSSDAGFGSLLLQMYKNCGSSLQPSGPPDLQIQLSEIPPASTVVVDSAQHTITVATTNADGTISVGDGTYLVQLATNQAIQWLDVHDCDKYTCLCVSAATPCAPGTVAVTIQTQNREG